jgi:cellobiose phosphorylase
MAHFTGSTDPSVLEGTLTLDGARLRSSVPTGNVLSNGRMTSLVLSTGATRLTLDDLAINRWRLDAAHGSGTIRIYVRDLEQAQTWGLTDGSSQGASVVLEPGVVCFEQRLGDSVTARMDVFVAADIDAEVRRVTLRNDGEAARRLDVTSYVEVVLGPQAADTGHPAFSKLFVQTRFDPEAEAIHAWRRLRSPDERPARFVHCCRGAGHAAGFETSRFAFLGRGRTLDDPQALDPDARLEGLTGSVLDPVASLRRKVDLQPGEEVSLTFFTGASREDAAIDAMLQSLESFDVDDEMRAAVASELRRQLLEKLEPLQARYYRRLYAAMISGDRRLRAPAELIARLDSPVSRLGDLKIDPTLPLVLIRVSGEEDLPIVRSMLRAHRYWRSSGLLVNMYVLNDVSDTDSAEALQARIEQAMDIFDAPIGGRGGVFSDYADDVLASDQILLQSHASILIRDTLPSLDPKDVPVERPHAITFIRASNGLRRTELEPLDLAFPNGYGGFTPDGDEYVVDIPFKDGRHVLPPQPWANVIANEDFGFVVSETGGGYTWSQNSRENRLTPWSNDVVADPPSDRILIEDAESGEVWSAFPGEGAAPTDYRVRHGFGYSVFESVVDDLRQEVTVFVDRTSTVKVARLVLVNGSTRDRSLRVVGAHQLVLGADEEASPRLITLERLTQNGAIVARNRSNGEFRERRVYSTMSGSEISFDRFSTDRFSLADVMSEARKSSDLSGNVVVHSGRFDLEAGSRVVVNLLLGDAESEEALKDEIAAIKDDRWDSALADARAHWRHLLRGVRICTPAPEIDFMVNGWLPYQNLACRMWGRSAFYQSGGAYGYRDQLQDSSAMLFLDPSITRRQILLHAEQQFEDGDVMHWWHPPTGKGIRTRFSDDLLWLPYITATYVSSTGDHSILDEATSFIESRKLKDGEDEIFVHPERLDRTATVYEHCCLAIDRSLTRGPNGLPLMGTGDWNDGMNRVGREGRGESVWLGFFIATIIDQMLPICDQRGDAERVNAYRTYRDHLQNQLNDTGWDGEWYRRAYYDNGAVLGSKESDEGKIDALAQAWAVISDVAPAERATSALDAMERELVDEEAGIIRLLKPAFDRTPNDPGYIKGYVPGVRENGGQYTHAALWAVRALAEAGRVDRAAPLLAMLSPISHSATREAADRYRVEPYVIAADVYGEPPHVGRGGWTWYTGSAGWMYRVMLESVLGFRLVEGKWIELNPAIPAKWKEFSIRFRVPGGETVYDIDVRNGSPARRVTIDDHPVAMEGSSVRLPIERDGKTHRVIVEI